MASGGPYTVEYSEGLNIGYRWFDSQGIDPLFPFGHGLSYTTFRLSNLEVTPRMSDGTSPIRIRGTVENTGTRRGAEVPQVYLGLPASTGEPPKRLVGFEKVWLEPGDSRRVEIVIDPGASSHPLSTWDSDSQRWVTVEGVYQLYVGTSSANLPLPDSVTVSRARATAIRPPGAPSLDDGGVMRLKISPRAIEQRHRGAEWRLMLRSPPAAPEQQSTERASS